jgi:hypothetical protein
VGYRQQENSFKTLIGFTLEWSKLVCRYCLFVTRFWFNK